MFWRSDIPQPLERELYDAVMRAHGASAHRKNCSTLGLLNAYAGSGDYVQALIGALATLGGKHAPLLETYKFLSSGSSIEDPLYSPEHYSKFKTETDPLWRAPGWGNSFVRGEPDALWGVVEECLDAFPIGARLREITEALHAAGKMIYPNPSAYTAAAAIVLKCPPEILPWFFVASRIASWSQILLSQGEK